MRHAPANERGAGAAWIDPRRCESLAAIRRVLAVIEQHVGEPAPYFQRCRQCARVVAITEQSTTPDECRVQSLREARGQPSETALEAGARAHLDE
jgi:hypothetical protein